MRTEIDQLLTARGGAASRAELLTVVSRNQLDDEVARGHLLAPFPRAYCRPWDADLWPILERAALASVGNPAALSHLTALGRWTLPAPPPDGIHVTVPIGRHPIGRHPIGSAPGLVVHRTRVPTRIREVDGLAVVEPATAIVRSWPLCAGLDQRAAAIAAVRRRLVRPSGLAEAAMRAVGMPGRAALLRLCELLDAGSESELELWGYLDVFDHPGLRHAVRQKVVQVQGRYYRLDLAFDEEQVAIELDGYRFHSTREQRERDMQRDAALASIGWLTLRFSHERLHGDVAGCRRDALAALSARRMWRRSG
jgi:very-short-patch-repair endonuclease